GSVSLDISRSELPRCANASIYPLFFSFTHVSLFGGTTNWTGWKTRVMSPGPPAGSGGFGDAFTPDLPTTPSTFFRTSSKMLVRASAGKVVLFAVIANTASSGERLDERTSSFRDASSALA